MDNELTKLIYIADLAGVAVFAISGALAAGKKSLDWLGVLVIAVVTAIGGGTIRDMLLGRHPVFWIDDPTYLYVIFAAAFVTLLFSRQRILSPRFLLIADAFGLALFAILGAGIAESAGEEWIIVVILGTMTGVAGGILRDVLTNDIPLILRRDLYATAAIAGILVYLLLKHFGLADNMASVFGILCSVGLRLAAIFLGLRLPIFQLDEEPS